jgi:hypothetical protein
VLFPRYTDIRGPHPGALGDLLEVPQGTGRLYLVAVVEDAHKGFPNEYRIAVCQAMWSQPGGWRYPTP